jgi:hypothetical protein
LVFLSSASIDTISPKKPYSKPFFPSLARDSEGGMEVEKASNSPRPSFYGLRAIALIAISFSLWSSIATPAINRTIPYVKSPTAAPALLKASLFCAWTTTFPDT